LLVHGWRVRDPSKTIGLLADPLRDLGYDPMLLQYGFTLTTGRTQFVSNKVAKVWSARTEPSDIVIGHSNGARVAFEMSHTGQNLASTMVWIHPALDANCTPGRSVNRLLVLHHPSDWEVRLGALMPNSIWGDMGYRGYNAPTDPFGRDTRIKNVAYGGHSPFLDPTGLAWLIDRWVNNNPVPRVLPEGADDKGPSS
jgi:hypothetical protein